MFFDLSQIQCLHILSNIKGLNRKSIRYFIRKFGSPKELLIALYDKEAELIKNQTVYFENLPTEHERSVLLKQLDYEQTKGVQVISFLDQEFPFNESRMPDAPLLIFVRGVLPSPDRPLLGIVGTRSMTSYGKRQINEFFESVQGSEVDIISGLAVGIDGYAQQTALDYGFRVHAILAHSLDLTYPKLHFALKEKIQESGSCISEYASPSPPLKYKFLERNRLIAGICSALWVVESAQQGGSLVTAQFAQDYNTSLLASPGPVDSEFSQGCNRLIATCSAQMYERPETITSLLNIQVSEKRMTKMERWEGWDYNTRIVYETLKTMIVYSLVRLFGFLNLPKKKYWGGF